MKQRATWITDYRLRITLDHVWLFAGIAFIALRPLMTTIPPHDFWWHLATGRVIVQTGAIPLVDGFSFTQAGQPFYNQGWLSQVLMFGLHSLGGIPLLLVVQAGVLALTYGLLLHLCIRRSGALRLSVGIMLLTTMPMSFNNWIVRPQTYVFPIFMAFLYILTSWRQAEIGDQRLEIKSSEKQAPISVRALREAPLQSPKHMLWLLPLLMIFWVNMHGSFVLGGALIGLTFVGEAARRFVEDRRLAASGVQRPEHPPLRQLFGWGAATAVAMLVNPRGLEVLGYVRNLLGTSAVTSLVEEWAPPTTRDTGGAIFFLFLIFVIVALAYARRRPDPVDMLLSLAFLWLALGAGRNNVWFGLVVTPLLIVQAASWRLEHRDHQNRQLHRFQGVPAMNAALIGLIALLLVLALPWIKPSLGLPPELGNLLDPNTPVAAVERMQADPQRPQRLFHAMGYGSYLIWAAPNQPVFIDPRIELYPFEQWQEYLRLSAGRDVDQLLTKYRIDGLLLDNKEQKPLLDLVRADPAWEVRYEDEYSTYLKRQ